MKPWRWLTPIALTLLVWSGPSSGFDLNPKVLLNTGVGILTNHGSTGGSSLYLGGLSLTAAVYPLPVLSVYVGYSFDFDLQGGTLPLSGFYGGSRFYFWGQGTRWTHDSPTSNLGTVTRSRVSFYTGLEVAQRSYYIPPTGPTAGTVVSNTGTSGTSGTSTNTSTTEGVSGSSFAFNALLGAEISLTEHLDLNLELNSTFLTFAATDSRYRIGGALLRVGFGILF